MAFALCFPFIFCTPFALFWLYIRAIEWEQRRRIRRVVRRAGRP